MKGIKFPVVLSFILIEEEKLLCQINSFFFQKKLFEI